MTPKNRLVASLWGPEADRKCRSIGATTNAFRRRAGGACHFWLSFPAALVVVALLTSASCGRTLGETLPAVTPHPPLLAVVTWNMNAGRGDLPRLVTDLAEGRLTGTPASDYLVFLQEAVEGGPHYVPAFARERGLSGFYIPVHDHGDHIRGNAILSTRPLLNARGIPLPQERQPRAAAAAAVRIAGEQLFVVSAHLENRVSWLKAGLLSDDARGRQADALLRSLPANGHGVVGGDMNTWMGLGEPAWRTLAERFTDTPAALPTATFRYRLVLDHLFFDLPAGWQAASRVVPDSYGSDHHPVVGVITRTGF